MSLPRKEVRVYVDHDAHRVLLAFAGLANLEPAKFSERVLVEWLSSHLHDARIIVSELEGLKLNAEAPGNISGTSSNIR